MTEDFLKCVSCHKTLTSSAKYLGCLHTSCKECLLNLEYNNYIRCSKCTSTTCLGANGIDGLPNNSIGKFAGLINAKTKITEEKKYCRVCKLNSNPPTLYCFACDYYLCQKCHTDSHQLFQTGHDKTICPINDLEKLDLQTLIQKYGGTGEFGYVACQMHPSEKAIYFCGKDCIFVCGAHESNYLISISDAIAGREGIICRELQESTAIIDEMKNRHNSLGSLSQHFLSDCDDSVGDANTYFNTLINAVNLRRDEVISEIVAKNNLPKQTLTDEVEKQDRSLEKYYDAQKFISWYYKTLPDCLLMNDYEAIKWYLSHVKQSKTANIQTLNKFAGILSPCEFIGDDAILEIIRVHGKVKDPAGGKGLEVNVSDAYRKLSSDTSNTRSPLTMPAQCDIYEVPQTQPVPPTSTSQEVSLAQSMPPTSTSHEVPLTQPMSPQANIYEVPQTQPVPQNTPSHEAMRPQANIYEVPQAQTVPPTQTLHEVPQTQPMIPTATSKEYPHMRILPSKPNIYEVPLTQTMSPTPTSQEVPQTRQMAPTPTSQEVPQTRQMAPTPTSQEVPQNQPISTTPTPNEVPFTQSVAKHKRNSETQISGIEKTKIVRRLSSLKDKRGELIVPDYIACDYDKYFYVLSKTKCFIYTFLDSGELVNEPIRLHRLHAQEPSSLAVGSHYGELRFFLTDITYNHLIILDSCGNIITTIKHTRIGPLIRPISVAVDKFKNTVSVIDSEQKNISILSTSGEFIAGYGRNSTYPLQLENPVSICTNSYGSYFVLDDADPLIIIQFSVRDGLINIFKPPFENIACPIGIAVSRAGRIYISDVITNVVLELSNNGELIQMYCNNNNNNNNNNNSIDKPCGMAIDTNDNLLLCNSNANEIIIINMELD